LKLQIKIDGNTYIAEVEVLDEEESQESYPPYPPLGSTAQPMVTPVSYAPPSQAQEHLPNDKQYRSPVNGLVIRVNVAAGQQIQPNDVLVVLEAMKMETTITAHSEGRVKSILVAQGDPAKAHQVLVEME
jgi:methylmalonyl-CoA carboxyltransferase small subunit